MNRNDLGQAFSKLVGSMFIPYKGVNIERIGDEYKVFGTIYPTLYLAQKRVDKAYNVFNNIVKTQNKLV